MTSTPPPRGWDPARWDRFLQRYALASQARDSGAGLVVYPKERTRERQRGGHQWIFPSHAVSVYAVWINSNVPPQRGDERCYEWRATLEACLPDKARPPAIVDATPGSQGCPPKAYAAHPCSVTIRFGHLPEPLPEVLSAKKL